MTPAQAAAYVQSEAVAAMIECEAMKAENKERESQGLSLAYGEKEFNDLAKRYVIGHNAVLTIFQECDYP